MRRFSILIALAIALFILARTARAVQPIKAPLHEGAVFPNFSGQTVKGRYMSLPGTARDKPTVLAFSFSRAAGNDARQWNQRLVKDFPDTVSTYGVIQLESAPKIFRGLAISGIKSSMPVSVQDRTIVLYRDEEMWKQRLAVTDENRAYVVALDRSGTVRWINSGAFSDAVYASLKSKLGALLQRRP